MAARKAVEFESTVAATEQAASLVQHAHRINIAIVFKYLKASKCEACTYILGLVIDTRTELWKITRNLTQGHKKQRGLLPRVGHESSERAG
jgi:hypothetical protein